MPAPEAGAAWLGVSVGCVLALALIVGLVMFGVATVLDWRDDRRHLCRNPDHQPVYPAPQPADTGTLPGGGYRDATSEEGTT